MKVIGYSFDADTYCVDCTERYVKEHNKIDGRNLNADEMDMFRNGEWEFLDSEGNPIHAMFDTDESGGSPDHCGNCHAYIDTSWSGECASYAVNALANYVEAAMNANEHAGNPEVLDEWEESLQWVHGLEQREELIIELYKAVREHERVNA